MKKILIYNKETPSLSICPYDAAEVDEEFLIQTCGFGESARLGFEQSGDKIICWLKKESSDSEENDALNEIKEIFFEDTHVVETEDNLFFIEEIDNMSWTKEYKPYLGIADIEFNESKDEIERIFFYSENDFWQIEKDKDKNKEIKCSLFKDILLEENNYIIQQISSAVHIAPYLYFIETNTGKDKLWFKTFEKIAGDGLRYRDKGNRIIPMNILAELNKLHRIEYDIKKKPLSVNLLKELDKILSSEIFKNTKIIDYIFDSEKYCLAWHENQRKMFIWHVDSSGRKRIEITLESSDAPSAFVWLQNAQMFMLSTGSSIYIVNPASDGGKEISNLPNISDRIKTSSGEDFRTSGAIKALYSPLKKDKGSDFLIIVQNMNISCWEISFLEDYLNSIIFTKCDSDDGEEL